MKINGDKIKRVNNMPPYPSFYIYKVKLKDGPMKDVETLVGNSTVLWCGGHRYELNANGDFVYSPDGQN